MRAVEFDSYVRLINNQPVPELKDNEALIKVHIAGICNTDLEIIKGYMNFSGILGHEFVGTVEKVNGNNQDLVGKRVVGEINSGCNTCNYCINGMRNHCPNRDVLGISGRDGCFADYITLPIDNLLVVPDSVTDEEAVFAEPLAAAFEIMEQVKIHASDKVLILGDGKLGLLIALALKLSGSILLAGKHQDKLDIAKEQGIKTILLDNLEIKKDFDIVIDATGSASGFELSLNLVKPRGTIVLKSTVAENKNLNLAPIVIDEITLIGSRCGPFKPALKALEEKQIDVKPLISGIFSFDQTGEAIKYSESKNSLKVLIDFRN